MAIIKVWIEESFTSCGLCEDICPDIFEMPDKAVVKENAKLAGNEGCIKEAAESCPVEIIKYEEE